MDESSETETRDKRDPQTVREFFERGWVHLVQNDLSGAEADFRQAISKNNRFAEGYFGIGLTLKKMSKIQEAREAFEKSISFLGIDANKEDQIRNTMLRRLAQDHLQVLQKET